MNKNKVLDLIKDYIVAKNHLSNLDDSIEGVTTNLQTSEPSDIVFYKIKEDDKNSLATFQSRVSSKKPTLLVLNSEATNVKLENTLFINAQSFLEVQRILCDEIYPNKQKMKIAGVTGTNGKTTTVNLAMQMAASLGQNAISVGTIGVHDKNGQVYNDLESTTPSYVELRKLIHHFQDNYDCMFMEVSSHALVQDRLHGIKLDAAAFTSFSQDHLDYHRTMEEYFKAKLLIESKYLKSGTLLIVPADELELQKSIIEVSPDTKFKIAKTLLERGIKTPPLFYQSKYNQSNAECALQLNEDLFGKAKLDSIKLENVKTPPGRFSIIELEPKKLAIVDYAHTPDALLNIGKAIKAAFPGYTLTVVFGCGGNRDKTKRPLMGKAVGSFADKIVVTSDNPRDEAPEDIIIDILSGLTVGYEAVVDRKSAIELALSEMEDNEIVLIAGKGHEEYQEIKGIKHDFSDFEIVSNFKLGL